MSDSKPAIFMVRLREIRTKRKVSIAKMAQVCAVSRPTADRWEKYARGALPDSLQMVKICVLLKTNSQWLLGLREDSGSPLWPTEEQRELLAVFEQMDTITRLAFIETGGEVVGTTRRHRVAVKRPT